MKRVLIIGGGLAACTVARDLTYAGIEAWIVERNSSIGGKVRNYGCKAVDECLNCGLCTAVKLWENVEKNDNIQKLCNSTVTDIVRKDGFFMADILSNGSSHTYVFSDIVAATGFHDIYEGTDLPEGVIGGNYLELLFKEGRANALFKTAPRSVAFLLCSGSRTAKDQAPWCSRYCCGFSGRAARVFKHIYPECKVSLFYTDFQETHPEYCMAALKEHDIELIKCRARCDQSLEGRPVVYWEGTGGCESRAFDKVVLVNGIVPGEFNRTFAELTSIRENSEGFLEYVKEPECTGIYLAGTVKGPMTINETAGDAAKTAVRIVEAYRKGVSA